MDETSTLQGGFQELGIAPEILSVLDKNGIKTPTPIQHSSIPVGLRGEDVLGIAQTGTGKTFAFGLPMLQRLASSEGHALILMPTRELAQQAYDALMPIARELKMGMAVFVGGASMEMQRRAIKQRPRILIATPGRLIDHLEKKTITLKTVSILILDEADRMLDMGFLPQLKEILRHVPTDRQTLLFSATMPKGILDMTAQYMRTPVHIEIAPAGTAAEKVEQAMIIMHRDEKPMMLEKLLHEYEGSILVFIRTKHGAKKLTRVLHMAGHKVAEIHANRSLAQRKEALDGFKKGRYRVLIATDIAARGIDVTGIEVVVNYDLPDNIDEYVHRIGRTGRAGRSGQAVSFATPDQRSEIRKIEKLIRKTFDVAELPSVKGVGVEQPRTLGRRPKPKFRMHYNRGGRR